MFRSSINNPSAFSLRTNNQTVFASNVTSSFNTASAVFDSGLLDIYTEVVELSKLYAEGSFTTIKEQLTNDKYMSLSLSLGRLRGANDNPEFEMVRSFTLTTLTGLHRAHLQNLECENMTANYLILKDRANILDDMDRLKIFIANLNSSASTSVFGDYSVTASVSAVISRDYLLYIEAYGFPQDAVFDADKLASINIRSRIL